MGDVVPMHTPSPAAARGLKLLSPKNRRGHPLAQVVSLRRIAVRAMNDHDWIMGVPNATHRNPPRGPITPTEQARAARQMAKATDATEAMQYLNLRHGLGYPVLP